MKELAIFLWAHPVFTGILTLLLLTIADQFCRMVDIYHDRKGSYPPSYVWVKRKVRKVKNSLKNLP